MIHINTNLYTLITGASAGIGKALARECAGRRMNLYLIDLPGTGLKKLSEQLISETGIEAITCETDLTAANAHHQIYDYAQKNNIHVNMLINNVGVGFNGELDMVEEEFIIKMLMLNIMSTTLITKTFLPMLKTQKKACILNVSSLGAFVPLPGKGVYSASKAYVLYLTKALRTELRRYDISVSAVFPAGVPTNQMVRNRIRKSSFLGKILVTNPDQVATAAINGMLKGTAIIFPSRPVKTFFFSSGLIPQGIFSGLLSREFKRAPE